MTARLATTPTVSPPTTPNPAATASTAPNRIAAATIRPLVVTKVTSAGTPMNAATSMPRASVPGRIGSSANRAGSSVSSTPKNSSGTSVQPRTTAAPTPTATT